MANDISSTLNVVYADDAIKLLNLSDKISNSTHSFNVRSMICYLLISCSECINRNRSKDPVDLFHKAIITALTFLKHAKEIEDLPFLQPMTHQQKEVGDAASNRYNALFSIEAADTYISEPLELLRQRFERNDFPISSFPSWKALESGCGNGRYAVALRGLGMGQVVGVDVNSECITGARQRANASGIDKVEYRVEDAVATEFPNGHFDFVFSNGVCERVDEPIKYVAELLRVLKPGGAGFFNTRAKNVGVHHDCLSLVKLLTAGHELAEACNALCGFGLPPSMVYHYQNDVADKTRYSFSAEECVELLSNAGAVNIRRCERGADTDPVEEIYRGEPYAREIFGDGDNRFYFEKSLSLNPV